MVVALAVTVLLVTGVPYWYAVTSEPRGSRFLGFVPPDSGGDVHAYLSWIRQGREGKVLFENLFTPRQETRVFHPFFLALGGLSRITGLGLQATFHLSRAVLAIVLFICLHRLCMLFLPRRFDRLLAMVLFAFSGGLGWLFPDRANLLDLPVDRWMPESNIPFLVGLNPLFCAALALLVLTMACFQRARTTAGRRPYVAVGICALALVLVHPYDMVTVYAVLGLSVLSSFRRSLRPFAVVLACSAPVVLYDYFTISSDPELAAQLASAMPSPAPHCFLLGLGLPMVLAAGEAYHRIRARDASTTLLLIWIALGFLLVYLPLPFQRRLFMGVEIPTKILAAAGMGRIYRSLRGQDDAKRRVGAAAAVALLLLATTPTLWTRTAAQLEEIAEAAPPLYLPDGIAKALDAVEDRGRGAVLCSPMLGMVVPWWTGRRVVAGHWFHTPAFFERLKKVRRFFHDADDPARRRAFLVEHDVGLILVDQSLLAWLGRAHLPGLGRLGRVVYRTRWATIIETVR
jgi:hypothetical protein